MKYLLAIIAMPIVYLLTAFINWDINPGNWTEFSRFSTVLFGLVFAVIAAAAIHDIESR